MNKNTIVLILSFCIAIISAAILAVGPITNKKIGANWGIQNCGLIDDQLDTLTYDSEKLNEFEKKRLNEIDFYFDLNKYNEIYLKTKRYEIFMQKRNCYVRFGILCFYH